MVTGAHALQTAAVVFGLMDLAVTIRQEEIFSEHVRIFFVRWAMMPPAPAPADLSTLTLCVVRDGDGGIGSLFLLSGPI